MTNTEKRSLYESIMNDVAKTVKRHLNESNGNPFTRRLQYLLDHEDEISGFSKAALMSVIDRVQTFEEDGRAEDEKCLRKIGQLAGRYGC